MATMANDEEYSAFNNSIEDRRQRRTAKMGFWSKTMFQRIFMLSLIRLVIYLHKLYQDCDATKTYHHYRHLYYEAISLACLILPSIVYAVYQSVAEFIKNDDFNARAIVTKFVNGLMLIPWQIKRHLDGLYFASQNLCSFRDPKDNEKENIVYLKRNAETLEFFEDFYAGFIQVIMQLYILRIEENSKLEIFGEMIGSALSVFSMLIAIRRKDDGIFTGFLSYIGWISMFTSRVLVFVLGAVILKTWILVPIALHVICFTYWVYQIAMEALEMDVSPNRAKKRGTLTLILIFFFFGLPSLVLWPFMFHLKEKKRPMVFLVVIFIENTMIALFWYFLRKTDDKMDMYLLLAVFVTTLMATLFLSLYFCCKPSKVDQVVLHDMRYTDCDSYGIYFEFCEIVFNLHVQREVKELLEVIREQPELTGTPNDQLKIQNN